MPAVWRQPALYGTRRRPPRRPYESVPTVSSGPHRAHPCTSLPLLAGSVRGTRSGAGGPGVGAALGEAEPATHGPNRRIDARGRSTTLRVAEGSSGSDG